MCHSLTVLLCAGAAWEEFPHICSQDVRSRSSDAPMSQNVTKTEVRQCRTTEAVDKARTPASAIRLFVILNGASV